jgi:hypothetical protein
MQTILLNGEILTPDPLGAAYWAREETLIVSDLHFEKGSSFAARGVMLPPYDTRTTLMRLGALIRKFAPKRVISLGDAFHDEEAETRIDEDDAATLEALMRSAEWLWILGNHDPEPPIRFSAPCEVETQIGALTFRHEPEPRAVPGEIAGHLHPCARVISEGRTLRRRCFAVSSGNGGADRMVMPAMGAYTGGLNILDRAFAPLFAEPVAWVMGVDGVYPILLDNLAPDIVGGALGRAV